MSKITTPPGRMTYDKPLRLTADNIIGMRNKLVKQIADEFEQSGIEYTCGAVVMDFAQKQIIRLTDDWSPMVKIHRHMTFWKIKRETWYEVDRRKRERQETK
jgi:hypothetical protein